MNHNIETEKEQRKPSHEERVQSSVDCIRILHPDDSVYEIRGGKWLNSGYFKGEFSGQVARADDEETGRTQVCINPLAGDCYHRSPERLSRGADAARSDQVVHRRWLLIDIDPDRLSGIASTSGELGRARQCSIEVIGWLKNGWPGAG